MTTRNDTAVRSARRPIGAEDLSLLIAAIILAALIGGRTEVFFSAWNLFNIGLNVAVVGLVALGKTMVIVSAGLAVSVGPIAGCASVVCALMVSSICRMPGGIGAGIIGGLVLGLMNAVIRITLTIPARLQ